MNPKHTDKLDVDDFPDIQSLLEAGIDSSRLILVADSPALGFKGDFLAREQLEVGDYEGTADFLQYQVTANSVYDRLPEAMFLLNVRENALEREYKSRLFFAPFDTNSVYVKAYLRLMAAHLTARKKQQQINDLTNLFSVDPEELDENQANQLVSLLPVMHLAVSNVGFMEHFLSAIFKRSIEILENQPLETPVPDEHCSRLGTAGCSLGENLLTGNKIVEYDSGCVVMVSLEKADDIADFAPGTRNYRFLNKLLENMISFQYHYEIKFRFTNERIRVKLGDESGQAYLGQTTYV